VGLTVAAGKALTARTTELTFRSRAMDGPMHAVVILPSGYNEHRTQRYPVLYLLHGHGGRGYLDWVNHGAERLVGNAPMIVVIPEGGYDGFYSDWYGTDIDGHNTGPPPAWETFHVRELLPWIDDAYRTIAGRTGRAIAGNSMGGFGAMSYAARHPDLFVAAGAFSGAVHPLLVWPVGSLGNALAPNLADGKAPDLCIWGDPMLQYVRWADHDPTALAANLGGLAVYARTGDGSAGRYDNYAVKQPSPGAVVNEFGIGLMNTSFDRALGDAGVAHTAIAEHGIHDWPYWVDDLRQFLPIAQAAFAHPPPAPPLVPFAYTSGASRFGAWGWTFVADHADQTALVTVDRVHAGGLRVLGEGRLHVDTAPLYRPGATYVVGGRERIADRAGRLHFDITLAPRGTYTPIV
jgi:S-formylglutathione hydrolase FrmB